MEEAQSRKKMCIVNSAMFLAMVHSIVFGALACCCLD